MNQLLESTSIYSDKKFLEKATENKKIPPLCLIVDGIIDVKSFHTIINTLFDLNSAHYTFSNNLELILSDLCFEKFNLKIKPKLELQHYEVFSIFLKKSLTNAIVKEFSRINTNLIYLYLEDNSKIQSVNTQNVKEIKVSHNYPQKYLYGFKNFSDLIEFYTELVKAKINWPILALMPDEQDFIKENKINQNFISSKSYPLFQPFKFLFYFSFIEKCPPNPKKLTNVGELYNIKNISDVQISHLYQKSDSIIRTFFGFENKFRCLQAFEFISHFNKKEKSIFDLILINNDQFQRINIKYDLFYIEIQKQLESSILFSINNIDAFNLNMNETSTFLSFDNLNDFYDAKIMIKKLLFQDESINYYFKNIKLVEKDELSLLFPSLEINDYLIFIVFRMKQIGKNSKKGSFKLSNILKNSVEIKKDVLCSFDKKLYIVSCFNDKKKGEKTFSELLKSKYSIIFNIYYPENFNKSKEKIESINQKDENKNPIFKPKEGLFYIYFQEYQKSKVKYPSNNVRPLFGIQNIVDLQRNYYLPNNQKEYTFIGFSSKQHRDKAIHDSNLRKNALKTNALNGIIVQLVNNKTSQFEKNYDKEVNCINNQTSNQSNERNKTTVKINDNSISINDNNNKHDNKISDSNNRNMNNNSNNYNNDINENNNNINDNNNEQDNKISDSNNINISNNSNNYNNSINDNNNNMNDNNNNMNDNNSNINNSNNNMNEEIDDFNYKEYSDEETNPKSKTSQKEVEDFNYKECSFLYEKDIILKDEMIGFDEYIQKMANIQNQIDAFLKKKNCNDKDYKEISNFISDQQIKKYLPQVKEVLNILLFELKKHTVNEIISEKITFILSIFKDDISQHFTRHEIFNFFRKNKYILLYLTELKVFSFNKKFSNILIDKDSKYLLKNYHYFFFPEIRYYIDSSTRKKIENKLKILYDDIEAFKEIRKMYDVSASFELLDDYFILDETKDEEEDNDNDENSKSKNIKTRSIKAIKNHNYKSLPKDLSDPKYFFYLCKYNYITPVKILLNTNREKLNLKGILYYVKYYSKYYFLIQFLNYKYF